MEETWNHAKRTPVFQDVILWCWVSISRLLGCI